MSELAKIQLSEKIGKFKTSNKPPICAECDVRLDGSLATYCYHAALEEAYPGDGRPIDDYPDCETPNWCPGPVLVKEHKL